MIYTKNGDDGTSFLGGEKLDKSNLKFTLLGDIDELSSYIGLIKAKLAADDEDGLLLDSIQENLFFIAASVNGKLDSKIKSATLELEQRIDFLQGICKTKGFVRPGGCELSAIIDICRCVTRRAERSLCYVKSSLDSEALRYINRLSDYLFALARYIDFIGGVEKAVRKTLAELPDLHNSEVKTHAPELSTKNCRKASEAIEEYAKQMKIDVAIAFCDADGRVVLACAPKSALIISFDCAIKKAYTAVALKMSTTRAQELVSPGGIFYGLSDTSLLTIPGGMPILHNNTVIGGIGISGGDDVQDTELANYGTTAFLKIL